MRMTKRTMFFVGMLVFALIGCNTDNIAASPANDEIKLDNPKNRISYTIGLNIGRDFASQDMEIDPKLVLVGIEDAMAEKEPRLSEDEMIAEIQAFQQDMQAKAEAKLEQVAEENRLAGEMFLADNATKEGVVVTESGLQYKMIEPGEGEPPDETDMVTVHYRGTLIDGTQFDSSYDRDQPATFPVNGVIPGWTEALQMMKPGSKYQLFIPPDLAYGERGAGRDIGPNATLIFDVELISVSDEVQ